MGASPSACCAPRAPSRNCPRRSTASSWAASKLGSTWVSCQRRAAARWRTKCCFSSMPPPSPQPGNWS
eukprot:14648570-Alexandrium_andersonii.AAC.1